MKNLYLKSAQIQEVFKELKDDFKGSLTEINGEYNLSFQSNFTQGNIQGRTFSDGITYLNFDLVFNQEVQISIESCPIKSIVFAYCSKGVLQHSFGETGKKKALTKNGSGVLRRHPCVNSLLYFAKNTPTKFTLITTNVNSQETELAKSLKNTFLNVKEDCLKISVQNFQIAKKINELNALNQKDNSLDSKNAIIKNIIKLEIKQNKDSFSEIAESFHSLMINSWNQAKEVTHFILDFPSKIEAGFKLNSNKAMNAFLTHLKI